mgnify:CR=1 FL=1
MKARHRMRNNSLSYLSPAKLQQKNPQRAFEIAEANLKSGYSPTLVQTIIQLQSATIRICRAKLSKALTTKLLSETFLQNPQRWRWPLTS